MALLYVTEFAEIEIGPAGRVGQMPMPPVAEQTVAIGVGSVASNAFNAKTRFVRLHTDAICAVKFGTAPTAIVAGATGTARMAANQTEFFAVPISDQALVRMVEIRNTTNAS